MFRTRFLAFALAALACSPALAADWSMAGGAIHFSTPDGWTRIMSSSGDPEVMAFQVPEPSPSDSKILARIVVSVTTADSSIDFKALVSEARERAATQPGAKIDNQRSSATALYYTDQEGGTTQVTREHFVRLHGHAVELSCIRPGASATSRQWAADFDHGCERILKQIR